MSIEHTPGDALPPRTDLYAAVVWIVFGAAIAIGAWNMDRLQHRNINPYEIPGLVPGVLGAVIVLLGVVLALRSLRRGAWRSAAEAQTMAGRRHLAQVFAATLLYALVLVGHGIAFWLATFGFVAGFILHFDRERQRALGRGLAAQAWRAAVYGVATSAIVTLVFEHVFLVRLP